MRPLKSFPCLNPLYNFWYMFNGVVLTKNLTEGKK